MAADLPEGLSQETYDFLQSRGAGTRVEGIQPDFATRLHQALMDAEAATGATAQINSLKRTTEEQAAAYQRYQSGQGGLAAKPGSSRHEYGGAADVNSGPVLDWLHQNAGNYGLVFPYGARDRVHIQMAASPGPLPSTSAAAPQPSANGLLGANAIGQAKPLSLPLFGLPVGLPAVPTQAGQAGGGAGGGEEDYLSSLLAAAKPPQLTFLPAYRPRMTRFQPYFPRKA